MSPRTNPENKPSGNYPWRTFSIFISSTFADMQAERDYLKQIVFPRVEEELQKRRIKLEIVDLRWGVDTTSMAQEDEREASVLKVCLDEIKRCRPFFIGLLGDRYGWVPSEERMKNAVVGESLVPPLKGKSVTALEIEFGVLAGKEQLSRSVFYFREPLPYEKFSPERASMFIDENNPELSEAEKQERKSALENLKTSICEHFEKKKLPEKVKTYRVTWDDAREKVTGLEAWGEIVYVDILSECKSHAEATWDKVPRNWKEQELELLDAFIEGHTAIFCGRNKLLIEIKDHLLSKEKANWGMVLTGESGSGKSSVFAMVKKTMDNEDCFVLSHSAGLSPRAKNVLDLLLIWNKQLYHHLGIEEKETEEGLESVESLVAEMEVVQKEAKPEIEKIQERFRELLFTVAEKQQVVLLVDALDRFEPTERASFMTWLPTVMPGNIRMLCTAITHTEEKAVQYHSGLFVKNLDFFTKQEAKEMLDTLCRQQHKTLPQKVTTTILEKVRADGHSATSSPLWLSLAVNMMITLDHDDFEKMSQLEGRGDQQIESYMANMALDFDPLPGRLFLSLVKKAGQVFGENFTNAVFNYLACSRNGLREKDLEKLLEAENIEWDPLLFAWLRRWFKAHLIIQGEELQWNMAHSILRTALIQKASEIENKRLHNKLAAYLLTLVIDPLKTTETLYHLLQAGNLKEAATYYGGELTAEEVAGAITVLAEAIAMSENGLIWAGEMILDTKNNDEKAWKLAQRFIYYLDDALAIEGNLDARMDLLEHQNSRLTQSNASDALEDYRKYNYVVLYQRLANIYGELGNADKSMKYYINAGKISKQLYESNPENTYRLIALALSYSKLGGIYEEMGNMEEALKYLESAFTLFKDLCESEPQNQSHRNLLAICYERLGSFNYNLGNVEKALQLIEEGILLAKELYESYPKEESHKKVLRILYSTLGITLFEQGHMEKAVQILKKVLLLAKEQYESHPRSESLKNGLAISYSKLGDIHQSMGHMDEALGYFEKSLLLTKELCESNPQNVSMKNGVALSYSNLGDIYQDMGHMEEALQYFEKSSLLSKEVCESNPQIEYNRNILAVSYTKLGDIYLALGYMEKSLQYFDNAVKLFNELYNFNLQSQVHKNDLAISYERLGDIHQAMGHIDEALTYFEKYLFLAKELYESNPKIESHKNILANSYQKVGSIHNTKGHIEVALKNFEKSSLLVKELYDSNPQKESHKTGLAFSYSILGDIHQSIGHFEESLHYFEKYSLLAKELYEFNQQNELFKNGLAFSFEKLGGIHNAMGNIEEALQFFKKYSLLAKELYESTSQKELHKKGLAVSYERLGEIHQSMGHMEEALKCFDEEARLFKELYEANPLNESLKNGLAISYQFLGDIHHKMGHLEEALKYFEKRTRLGKELYEANPQNESLKNGLAISYSKLGDIHQAMGHLEEALKYFEKFNQLVKELYEASPKNINLLEGLGISYYKLAMIYKEIGNNQAGRDNFAQWKSIIAHLAKNLTQVPKYTEWDKIQYD